MHCTRPVVRRIKLLVFAAAASLILSAPRTDIASANSSAETIEATKVVVFHPAIPKGPAHKGYCWTESDAIDRAGAWRCMVGDLIYDPCLSDPRISNGVICGADPARGQLGFVLELTKPLPAPRADYLPDPIPWLVKLADGSICELATGTSAQVDGKDVPYECSDARDCTDDGECPYLTGITTEFKHAKVWRVDKVAFQSSKGVIKLLKRKSVRIAAIWK